MQVKLLYNLVEELAGENTGSIAEILFNKRDVNEFTIAKKMNLTINQVRNILYKLSNFGLVSFIRKKDEKKGWYIYFWTLNTEKCLLLIEQSLQKKIDSLNEMLNSREIERYYICKPCNIEVKEEQALENGFSCEECAEVYELSDNTPHVRDIKSKTTKILKELETIQGELTELREKETKKREKEAKKTEKEEHAKKELIKLAREAAKKKLKKKEAKETKKKTGQKKVKKREKKKVAKKIIQKIIKKVIGKKLQKKKTKKSPQTKKKK